MISVTGSFYDSSGTGQSGSVQFIPTAELTDATGSIIVTQTPLTAVVTSGTMVAQTLATTDNSGLSPSGWQYAITVSVPGASQTFNAYIPSTLGATVDLSVLQPSPATSTPGSPYVSALNGLTGELEVQIVNGVLVVAQEGSSQVATGPSGATTLAALGGLAIPAGSATSGLVPVATGTGSGTNWRAASGQFLCAPNQYAPPSQTEISVNSTTLAAWSSGVICTNSFTAPASGKVLVTARVRVLDATSSSAGHDIMFGLSASVGSTSLLPGSVTDTAQVLVAQVLQNEFLEFYVTGLISGTSYQFDLLGAITSGDTATIYAYGPTSTTVGSKGGPVIITVQAI
jgi:hypothetical protein